jgi:serine/threonine protein kinase
MDIPDSSRRFRALRLDTRRQSILHEGIEADRAGYPFVLKRWSQASEGTTQTTPVNIPMSSEHGIAENVEKDASSGQSSIEQYLRERQPSISFNQVITLESGHRQSINEPLQKPAKNDSRGRSVQKPTSDERQKPVRAHSESDRTHYDPVTGLHLPKYSVTPPRDYAHLGEQRFPLLQATVDELARESQTDLPQTLSMTSNSTMSPISDLVQTPQDEPLCFILSPSSSSSFKQALSYEEPKEFKRTASQRWRDGQVASDFFARANMRKSTSDIKKRTRTLNGSSFRSLGSAASSYLRGFSLGSIGDSNDDSTSCDAEGQTIGENYVLGKQIGYGGFSVIKEVTQIQDSGAQRKLAVKIVRRNIDGKSEHENDRVQAEFEHEVELWRLLSHSRILPLEAVYKTDEATFCFIPINTSGTLFDLVRNNRNGLPTDLAKRYTYQLASALRYLHCDTRVVHRDVKLENVLLDTSTDKEGNIRLCDFGMAEWISNDNISGPPSPGLHMADRLPPKHMGPADTSSSAFAGGSLEYAAPEILRIAESTQMGNSGRSIVSPAVDIWALGVCIYTMVVGSRPFSNTFQPRVVMAILAGDWDKERLERKGGPDVLELVEGCLELNEAERWDIEEVLSCDWLNDVADDEEGMEENRSNGWRL